VDHPTRRHPLTVPTTIPIPDRLDATLVLVRHGESQYIVENRFQGQADSPLSPTGLRQAQLVARRLASPHEPPALPVPIGRPVELIHSPLERTAQTARAIAEALSAGGPAPFVRADPGFLEIGQGAWEGLHAAEIAERFGPELGAWRRRPLETWAPGGESLPDVAARVRPALAGLLERLAEGRPPGSADRSQVAGYHEPIPDHPWSIVVAHDGVFKVTLLTLFDLPLDRFWMWSMDLCGITVVDLRAGRPVLRAHNLTAHLSTLQDEEAVADLEDRSRSGAL
jgi:broad specificity phosphatase PhoE